VQIGLPEQARRHRAPGAPLLAEFAQLLFARPPGEAETFGDGELQAEIGGRPDVGAAEREDQIDLGAPPPDPLERYQRRPGLVVRHPGKRGEIEPPARHRIGETARIGNFLPAEAAALQCRVVEREKILRRQRPAGFGKPPVHRRRRVDRHLLLEDDVQQRRKPVRASPEARRPGPCQDRGEYTLAAERGDAVIETSGRQDHAVAAKIAAIP
jgi:hypothetical protein